MTKLSSLLIVAIITPLRISEKLLSHFGQCGSWNDLAEIDCTATPKINVLYTMEMHDIKLRMLENKFIGSSIAIKNGAESSGYSFRGSESLGGATIAVDFVVTSAAGAPTAVTTRPPTGTSTRAPTVETTRVPTVKIPTGVSTSRTTAVTRSPTAPTSRIPTRTITKLTTGSPTRTPSRSPTKTPSRASTKTPSTAPTKTLSTAPTKTLSTPPTKTSSTAPTKTPSTAPTKTPSTAPTKTPSTAPSRAPTKTPSRAPTKVSTRTPSRTQIGSPSTAPTKYINLLYNGGPIMVSPVVKLIFWGPSWISAPGDKIYGMDLFYKGYVNSPYANIFIQYTGWNGKVSNTINYEGYVIDSSVPPEITASTYGSGTGIVLSEVCAQIPNPEPSGNGYYVVYTEQKRGSAGYCGWHTYSYCGNVRVQFAFIFNLDGDTGCGCRPSNAMPKNPVSVWRMNNGSMSLGVHALAGVSAHELSETMTDPMFNAWYDQRGLEVGDKCAWTFPPTNSVFSNGVTWRIQGQWSNTVALSETGYTKYGCVGSA